MRNKKVFEKNDFINKKFVDKINLEIDLKGIKPSNIFEFHQATKVSLYDPKGGLYFVKCIWHDTGGIYGVKCTSNM